MGDRLKHSLAAAATLAALTVAGCTSSEAPSPSTPTANRLPLGLPTANAQQVVTVTASSQRASTAKLQAWNRRGTNWEQSGPEVKAYLGRGGLTDNEREFKTQSPIGSFTLTQAFGRLNNPGTKLPFFRTTPRDWWVSEPGPDYNTHQTCVLKCQFTKGSPNSQLFYVRPQYDLAVVIDYNRRPVVQRAGSGIFLHVTRGRPTAGCVSVDETDLVRLMKWLAPSKHPRILIGTG